MKTLYLLQGIPGSGKSTLAKIIADATGAIILSTDEYWFDSDGIYCYVPNLAGIAHAWNQRRCNSILIAGEDDVIIDNTNITQKEADPYLMMAKMYGYDVQIIRVEADEDLCVARQIQRKADRQIPWDVIRRKNRDMERLVIT